MTGDEMTDEEFDDWIAKRIGFVMDDDYFENKHHYPDRVRAAIEEAGSARQYIDHWLLMQTIVGIRVGHWIAQVIGQSGHSDEDNCE